MADWTAVYISANSFKVATNVSAYFLPTERVVVDCNGTLVYSSVYSVSYADGWTTVTLTESVLTDPCGVCNVGGVIAGDTGNLPDHDHSKTGQGGTGVIGSPAQYEWNGTQIRFKNTGGSWGEWVDIGGADGATWYTGIEEPSSELGVDGDYYMIVEDIS